MCIPKKWQTVLCTCLTGNTIPNVVQYVMYSVVKVPGGTWSSSIHLC